MPHEDNPAGRLFLILDAIWGMPPKSRLNEAWRDALNVKEEDEPRVMRKMASVFSLPSQIEREAGFLDTLDPAPVLEAMPKVLDVTKAWTSGNNVEWYRSRLGEGSLTALRMTSSALSISRPQVTVSKGNLERLVDLVTELDAEIEASELKDSERAALRDLVVRFSESLHSYDVDGAGPLEAAAQTAIGLVSTSKSLAQAISESKVGRALGKVIVGVLIAVAGNYTYGALPHPVTELADDMPAITQELNDELGTAPPQLPASTETRQPVSSDGPEPASGSGTSSPEFE